MRGLVCGLVMAAGLAVAPSAFAQSAVLIVSGGFGGPFGYITHCRLADQSAGDTSNTTN